MEEITGINHIGLRVYSLDVSREFYEKLGFRFIAGPMGPEPVAVMEHPSGVNINFILNANAAERTNLLMDIPEKYPGYTHVALEVTDLSAVRCHLEKMSIPLTGGPIVLDSGASFIFARDPDGNVIEFHQP
ncbi:VOC family protein [Pseudomaricurvus sp. HS19]|uniref:VOC family protein n=1 Tax=Pseudomaricurvus sp. HS19 TaxID=2692626 RepID=UPI00136F3994|nr:VOC family protein [Pseudomaricurvus sp. HS19]MYM61798.1 VOC family protein [Pseudomaricurvus sp. HS19]